MVNPRAVVDTTVVVNLLSGGADRDRPEWLEHSKWVFEANDAGDFDLVVPTIVIAEVAGCGEMRGNHLPRQVRRERIKAVKDWLASANFIPAEITLDVALRAATLAVDYQLRGADATVLAVAELHGCAWLFTWDADLLKADGALGDLRIINPKREYPAQDVLTFDE